MTQCEVFTQNTDTHTPRRARRRRWWYVKTRRQVLTSSTLVSFSRSLWCSNISESLRGLQPYTPRRSLHLFIYAFIYLFICSN